MEPHLAEDVETGQKLHQKKRQQGRIQGCIKLIEHAASLIGSALFQARAQRPAATEEPARSCLHLPASIFLPILGGESTTECPVSAGDRSPILAGSESARGRRTEPRTIKTRAEELGQRNFTLGVHSFALIPLPNLPRHPWRHGPQVGRSCGLAFVYGRKIEAGKCRIFVA